MAEENPRKFAKDFLEKWARAEREEGPAGEALAKIDEELKAYPDDAARWYRRGSLLLDLERWEEALAALRRVEDLAPEYPRLHLALAFALGKLGRPDDAAAAQQKALETAAVREREPEPTDAEEGLRSLAEELAQEVLEEEVVDRLQELAELDAEPKPEPGQEFEARLSAWAAAGYDVSPLRQVLEREPDRARTAFFQFEQNVRKVQVLEETLNDLDRTGLEPAIDRLRALFRAPYQIWKIEAEMATLLDSADARERTLRARTAPPPAPPARASAHPAGATNGRSPTAASRVNGLGAGAGRVNGMAGPGRVNGMAGPGRVNGLVNGMRAARAGLTNGITNGLGMTNGLGGRRFAAEARSRRWRLLLIPTVALVLLSVSLVAPPQSPSTSGGISVDGAFADWQGVRSYAQREIVSNPNVDLTGYAVHFQDGRLSVRGTVQGTMFGDANVLDVLWVFVDVDGDRGTGYDEGRIGADLLLEIRGGNGTVTDTATWEWPTNATDRDDWNAWDAAYLPFRAAISQGDLECQVDLVDFPTIRTGPGFDRAKAAIAIDLEDQRDSRSRSERIVGPTEGFLTVEQRPASSQINPILSDFLVLRFEANGSTVHVQDVTLSLGPGTPPLSPFSPFNVTPGDPQTVTLAVDGTGLAAGTLVSATVVAVDANRPATILGAGGRAYVGSTPGAPTVDGLFAEWNANRTDTDPTPVREPNVNITNYAALASNTTAYAFVHVVDTALGGTAAPVRRVKTITGGNASAPGPSIPRTRHAGEDTVEVLFEANGTAPGVPVDGIFANAFLDVRGRGGRVTGAKAFVWSGGWQERGTVRAIAVGSGLEASIDIPGLDFRGARFVIAAQDWKGVSDSTAAQGVRGTRSTPSGVTFVDSYTASVPGTADGWVRFGGPRGSGIAWQLPDLRIARAGSVELLAAPSPVPFLQDGFAGRFGGVYPVVGGDVAYAAEPGTFKETITLSAPPNLSYGDDLLLDVPFLVDANLSVYATGERIGSDLLVDGTLSFVDGRGLSIDLPAPWVVDASGRRLDLRFRLGTDRIAVEVPGDWLRQATYPIVLDPTVTYTLRDDGPSYKVGEEMGYSVAVGDFNGDGYADVLAGAPFNSLVASNVGYAYIYYGPFTADKTAPDVRFNGTTPATGRFGISVAAGKFNNDAYWDALIGRVSLAGSFTGPVDIFYGATSLSGEQTTPDVKFEPPSDANQFGIVVGAGNVDNANYDDVLIAETGRDNNGDFAADGLVYLYKSPFASDVTTADYKLWPSNNASGQLGKGGIAVGMVDSDAYPDVIIGEPNANSNNGRVQFYKGSLFTSGSGNRYPSATLSGSGTERFGSAVAVGKLDGDAYEDVVVGAPTKTSNNGAAYIFVANSDGSGLTTGASPSATLPSQSSGEQFGTSVLVLDFANTGTNGAVVGAAFANAGGTSRGSAYWFKFPLSTTAANETMSGSQSNEQFGWSLAGGKFASDAKNLLAIGAYRWDKNPANNGDNDGRVVVAFIPEPAAIMVVGILVLVSAAASGKRRGLVRKRRELGFKD